MPSGLNAFRTLTEVGKKRLEGLVIALAHDTVYVTGPDLRSLLHCGPRSHCAGALSFACCPVAHFVSPAAARHGDAASDIAAIYLFFGSTDGAVFEHSFTAHAKTCRAVRSVCNSSKNSKIPEESAWY